MDSFYLYLVEKLCAAPIYLMALIPLLQTCQTTLYYKDTILQSLVGKLSVMLFSPKALVTISFEIIA
jgi:hypothetical protein